MRLLWKRTSNIRRPHRNYATLNAPAVRRPTIRAFSLPWRQSRAVLFFSTTIALTLAADAKSKASRRAAWSHKIQVAEDQIRGDRLSKSNSRRQRDDLETKSTVNISLEDSLPYYNDDEPTDDTARLPESSLDGVSDHATSVVRKHGEASSASIKRSNEKLRILQQEHPKEFESVRALGILELRGELRKYRINKFGRIVSRNHRFDGGKSIERYPLPYGEHGIFAVLAAAADLTKVSRRRDAHLYSKSRATSPQSVDATREMVAHHRPYWTPKKALNTELCVAELAADLCLMLPDKSHRLGASDSNKEAYKSNLESIRQIAIDGIDMLHQRDSYDVRGVQRLQYPQYDPPGTLEQSALSHDLSRSIISIFSHIHDKDLSLTEGMQKVCYNLLVSRTPPDHLTWNLILSKLGAFGYQDVRSRKLVDQIRNRIVQTVVKSHVRVSEWLCCTIVDHLADSRNKAGFFEWCLKIRHNAYRGLMLANPRTFINHRCRGRIKEVNGRKRQTVQISHALYTSMIRGYLIFREHKWSVQLFQEMVSEGFTPGLGDIFLYLHSYASCSKTDKRYVSRGLEVWKYIEEHFVPKFGSSYAITKGYMSPHLEAECFRQAIYLHSRAGLWEEIDRLRNDMKSKGILVGKPTEHQQGNINVVQDMVYRKEWRRAAILLASETDLEKRTALEKRLAWLKDNISYDRYIPRSSSKRSRVARPEAESTRVSSENNQSSITGAGAIRNKAEQSKEVRSPYEKEMPDVPDRTYSASSSIDSSSGSAKQILGDMLGSDRNALEHSQAPQPDRSISQTLYDKEASDLEAVFNWYLSRRGRSPRTISAKQEARPGHWGIRSEYDSVESRHADVDDWGLELDGAAIERSLEEEVEELTRIEPSRPRHMSSKKWGLASHDSEADEKASVRAFLKGEEPDEPALDEAEAQKRLASWTTPQMRHQKWGRTSTGDETTQIPPEQIFQAEDSRPSPKRDNSQKKSIGRTVSLSQAPKRKSGPSRVNDASANFFDVDLDSSSGPKGVKTDTSPLSRRASSHETLSQMLKELGQAQRNREMHGQP